MINHGLLCDTDARRAGVLSREAGNQGIKAARRRRAVPIKPFGVVACTRLRFRQPELAVFGSRDSPFSTIGIGPFWHPQAISQYPASIPGSEPDPHESPVVVKKINPADKRFGVLTASTRRTAPMDSMFSARRPVQGLSSTPVVC